MKTLEAFNALTDTEEFFDFFDIDYDERLVYVKRFHIMKEFGNMVAKAANHPSMSDEKTLEYYKFALLSIYKNFENGYAPSAATVWDMFNKPSACGSCSTASSCNDIEGVTHGAYACTSQTGFTVA